MNTKQKISKLFNQFPEISSKDWKEKVHTDLKGTDFDKKLVWHSAEGINVLPYYLQADIDKLPHTKINPDAFPYVRGENSKGNDWKTRQNFNVANKLKEANKNALSAIEKGANSIGFKLSHKSPVNFNAIGELLEEIDLTAIEINFNGINNPLEFYNFLIEYVEGSTNKLSDLSGSLGVDPIGKSTLSGEIDEAMFSSLPGLIKKAQAHTPNFKIIGVNSHLFQDGGSTLVQELAFGLSVANEYMDKLTSNGVTPGEAMNSILFSVAVGPNYFMEIAKLRSARWLWSVICKEWGIPEKEITLNIHSQTAKWNLTVYDPFVNVLRSTTEAMSASLGGTNSISVHPYDYSFSEENEFSGRISRNLQIILKEEAYFDKVADPAAGSYYIETLTDSIAEQAWILFKQTEDDGGYLEAFKKGLIQEKIGQALSKKKERAGSRRESILGVNQYPNFNEMILDQFHPESISAKESNSTYQALGQYRISEDFEALRLQTEKSGQRPKVFLLKYGDPAWRTARAMFAGNFFGVAGYEIIDSSGFETIEEGIKAAIDAKSDIVVLCSADAAYAEIGPAVYTAMSDQSEIAIAGYPKDSIDDLKSTGINHFIHVKTNLLAKLTEFNNILKIS